MTRIADLTLPWRLRAAALLGAAALALLPHPAAAQDGGYAQPVVQALPDPAALRLNEALRRLAQDPRSTDALVEAGQASLSLDDVDAALGFFRRAAATAPADGRVKAGLAAVMVRQKQPLEALRLFAEAEQAGEPMRMHAAERGFAYDLIGDNARAQADYVLSLSLGQDPMVLRRLALSQAIAGDQDASERTLLPLLQHRDLAAYRVRAFALAILGKSEEAVTIAQTMLPQNLSSRLAPYLRYMPRLTRAQQAAAANLGSFPRAADIGRDDPAVAAYAAQIGVLPGAPPAARGADARLVPNGEPLGRRDSGSRIPRREDIAQQTLVTAAPPTAVQAAQLPPETAPQIVPVVAEEPAPLEERPQAVVVAVLPPEPVPSALPGPSISIAAQASTPAADSPSPADIRNISEAFAEFSLPAGPAVPAEGAVDITLIVPKREAPKVEPVAAAKPSTPPKPVIPSRHWVQVATGRDTAALAFDWRRVKRESGGLLDRTNPHVARWGQTNRLIAGPFASAREADDVVSKLKARQIDSFRFTSAQGEEVRRLN